MATSLNRLCIVAYRSSNVLRARPAIKPRIQRPRYFHGSQLRRDKVDDPKPPVQASENDEDVEEELDEEEEDADEDGIMKQIEELEKEFEVEGITNHDIDTAAIKSRSIGKTTGDRLGIFDPLNSSGLDDEQAMNNLLKQFENPEGNEGDDEFHIPGVTDELDHMVDQLNRAAPESGIEASEASKQAQGSRARRFQYVDDNDPENFPQPKWVREKPGLLAMGDEFEKEMGEDELFEGDDMSTLGHGNLEQHREIREYARIAAWEMPLLTKHAKEFVPPTASTPLRFRQTSYMGETHPAEPKIVLEFCTADLPLTPEQRLKLVKLLGARYNPQKDLAHMSCEMFPHAAQNKRYLGDLVDTLITESKNESTAEGGKDAFDDVPVDFRHVKWKTTPQFPEAWKVTPERREELMKGWRDEVFAQKKALLQEKVVDGVQVIQKAQAGRRVVRPEERREAVKVPRGQKVSKQLRR